MPSKNDPPSQPESQPPDLFSSVETRAMLEEFRELVRAGILRVTPENEVLPVKPPESGAGERQTSAGREEEVAQLDKQLLEWLERRKAQKGGEPRRRGPVRPESVEAFSTTIRQKVVERVAQKLLETWEQSSEAQPSLREQVVDRLADDILRRWQRGAE